MNWRLRINPRILPDKTGFTTKCDGCDKVTERRPPGNRSEECRKRIEAYLTEQGDEALKASQEKMMKHYEKQIAKRKHEEIERGKPGPSAGSFEVAQENFW